MPMCQPGREVPDQGITTHELIFEDAWGEVWKATHERLGQVLFIAYTTTEGLRIFEKSRPHLDRWKERGNFSAPMLIPILHVSPDSAIPYVLAEDQRAPTLRQAMADESFFYDPQDFIYDLVKTLKALAEVELLDLQPIGVTPDTLFYCGAENRTHPFRVLPVAPSNAMQALYLAGGRYSPPPLQDQTCDPRMLHPDTWSLVAVSAQALMRNWDLEISAASFEQTIPAPLLGKHLANGLALRSGRCLEPAVVEGGLKRWLRNEADKDVKKWRKELTADYKKRTGKKAPAPVSVEAIKKKTLGKSYEKKMGKKQILTLVGTILLTILLTAGGLVGAKIYTDKTAPSTALQSPIGAADRYFSAVLKGSGSGAAKMAVGNAQQDTTDLLKHITEMESSGKMAKRGAFSPIVAEKKGDFYEGQGLLRDAAGKKVLSVRVGLEKQGDGTYKVSRVSSSPAAN